MLIVSGSHRAFALTLETASTNELSSSTLHNVDTTILGSYLSIPQTSDEKVNLDYLAPLIVILLATLLSVIVLFSCVLCTCTIRQRSLTRSRTSNPLVSKPTTNDAYDTESSGANSPSTPLLGERNTKRVYQYTTLPVILAYQKAEMHAEWCPHHQPIRSNTPRESVSWDDNSQPIKVRTKAETLPWRAADCNGEIGTELRESRSEMTMDRVTVV